MDIRIRETGKVVSLHLFDDNGIDYVQDYIGNAGGFGTRDEGDIVWDDDNDEYVTDQDNATWWANHLNEYRQGELLIAEAAEDLGLGVGEINTYVSVATCGDIDRWLEKVKGALDDLRDDLDA